MGIGFDVKAGYKAQVPRRIGTKILGNHPLRHIYLGSSR